MPPELSDMIVGAYVPHVDTFVTSTHNYIAVASLLGTATGSAQIRHVLWISVELKTEDFAARK